MLERHGRPAHEVAAALNERLTGRVVHSDAWAHDYTWLARLFEEAGMAPAFKLESVGVLLDEHLLPLLRDAHRDAMAATGLTRHRASNDARAPQAALQRLSRTTTPLA